MGFKPMTLSQDIFQLKKISKERTYKILALMGFKPITLLENIFQLMKYQNRKPIKYWL